MNLGFRQTIKKTVKHGFAPLENRSKDIAIA